MSVVRSMKRWKVCRKVNLEEEYTIQVKHVDYLIDCDDLIVLVEETRKSKLDDLNKLDESVKWVRNRYRPHNNCVIIGIVHSEKKVDSQLPKALRSRMQMRRRDKQSVIYRIAKCEVDLNNIFNEYGVIISKT